MKNFLLSLSMLLSLALVSKAQSISGKVLSSSGEPIAFANVFVMNKSLGTVADKDGNYALDIDAGSYKITFSALGFATKIETVEITETTTTLDVQLNEILQNLDEVVVSANKKDEDLINVSGAVSSISSQKLVDTRTWGLEGLTALVPNYNYQELGVAFQQIQSIRGIQVFSENPAVATYIDDVNNLDILANGFALTDIERIEVLRGPQGTLFGRNAMGGVINIISKKPSNKLSAFAEANIGNLGLQRYALGIKAPIVKDKLFIGFNGLFQKKDGFLVNDTSGLSSPAAGVDGKSIGGENNLFGNLYVKWVASKRFSAALNFKAQRDWSDNSSFFISQPNDSLARLYPDKIGLNRIASHERNILNSSLVLKYFADKFTITSISAYQLIGLAFKDVDFPGFYHSFYNTAFGEHLPPQSVFSQELRINSTSNGKIQYTAGLYGFSQIGYEPSTNTAYELSPFEAAFYQLPIGSAIISRNRSNNLGVAAFGEVSYTIVENFKVTAGLRFDYEYKRSTFNGFGDAVFSNNTVTDLVPDTTVAGNYSALSPKVALSYAFNKQSNLYLSYNRGFRAGGINAQRYAPNSGISQTFAPEYSDNFELGYKTMLLDNKLRLGAAGFFILWQDLQFFNLAAPFTYARSNVGDAQSWGAELEATAIPVKGLQLDASFGLNITSYKDFELKRVNFFTGVETTTPIGGNKLSNAPLNTIFFAAQYELPVGKKLKLLFRGEVRNIGSYYTDIQNTLEQPSYTVVNARLGASFSYFSLFFWGQNLNNERYFSFGTADTSFGRSVRTAPPRTFGATLLVKF